MILSFSQTGNRRLLYMKHQSSFFLMNYVPYKTVNHNTIASDTIVCVQCSLQHSILLQWFRLVEMLLLFRLKITKKKVLEVAKITAIVLNATNWNFIILKSLASQEYFLLNLKRLVSSPLGLSKINYTVLFARYSL